MTIQNLAGGFRASCECGWLGDWHGLKSNAQRDEAAHQTHREGE